MQTEPINLTEVSPSCVGDYAVCLLKLVYDSDFPEEEEDDTYAPHRDFGTVCHYHAQQDMGADPGKKYTTAEFENARNHPKVPKRKDFFLKRVDKVVAQANSVLRKISPCPQGAQWIGEYKAYCEELMPNRVGRKGGKGFGGSIDLLLSTREILWDYKFTGSLPDAIKPTYLWQLCSYHLATEVPKTGILWTEVTGNESAYLIIDWTEPKMAALAKCIKGALKLMQLKNFREYAYPMKGAACFFCRHKQRCPVQSLPDIVRSTFMDEPQRNMIDDMLDFAGTLPSEPINALGGPPVPPPLPAAESQVRDSFGSAGVPSPKEPENTAPPPLPPTNWGIL